MPRPRMFAFALLIFSVVATRCEEDARTNAIDKSGEERPKSKDPWRLIERLKEQIAEKESALENAEQINRGFESMIQLISIMGQVDTFLTDRAESLAKKLATLADAVDGSGKQKRKQKS